ncbi:MAG: dicarboxylate/amino acid:cation symporter [Methylococcaceae bacterium]|nr:dicarboxylate/amino acid:cation symporter [Methylococcaceae bacterium]
MRLPSLNVQILAAAVFGALAGAYLNHQGSDSPEQQSLLPVLQLTGGLFVDLLKMVLIPLVFTSVASGVASLGGHEHSGRIWRSTLIYYLGTTALAAVLGLILMNVFEPGKGLQINLFDQAMSSMNRPDNLTLPEFLHTFLRSIFVSPVKAMAEGAVLPTVIFALLLGLSIARRGEGADALRNLLSEVLEVVLVMVDWIMRIAPVGVFALLAHLVATQQAGLFANLALFIAVTMGGLFAHGLIVFPGILLLTTGTKPWGFFRSIQEALLTAFATCSSSATLAVTMRVAREHLRVAPRIAKFILPLGATVNMDGTALYEAGAALFVANLAGIDLNVLQQGVVCLMAILASIGAPGLPSAGMVTMIMVLQSVGLPIEAIAILLPVDRLIDAVRTAINVEGDLVGSVVIDHFSRQASLDHRSD